MQTNITTAIAAPNMDSHIINQASPKELYNKDDKTLQSFGDVKWIYNAKVEEVYQKNKGLFIR